VTAVRALAWSITGNLGWSVAQWLVIVMLARLSSPETVGQYALGLAITAPLVLLAGLTLRSVQVTDRSSRFTFADYLRARVAAMLAVTVLLAIAALFLGDAGPVVLLVGVAKGLDAVGDIYFGHFQRRGQMRHIATSQLLNGALTVGAVAGLLWATGSIRWACLGSVAASAVAGVAYCAVAARPRDEPPVGRSTPGGRPDAEPWWRRMTHAAGLLVIAAPLGVASGVSSLTANVPRYLVAHDLGDAALGVFAALGYVVLVPNMVYASVVQIVLPRLTDHLAGGDVAGFARLTGRLVTGTLAGGVGMVVVVRQAGAAGLDAVYGAPYGRYADVLALLTVAAVVSGVVYVLNAALSALHRFTGQLVANAAALVVGLAAGLVLVPRLGLAGAAWLVILALATECLLKAVIVKVVMVKGGEVAAPRTDQLTGGRS
jgi:O-antigen/teichoic acid export membrane protein